MTQESHLILVGQMIAAHGIKGEVKIKSFTEDPLALGNYGIVQDEKGEKKFSLKIIGEHKGAIIVRIKDVNDRNTAEALVRTKTKLYVTRGQLPPPPKGRFYIHDLKGFTAVDEAGAIIATLTDIHNYGAGDILVFQPAQGKEFMLPFAEPFAATPDIKTRTILVRVPEGWRDEEKKKNEGKGTKEKKNLNKQSDDDE
jgi:16S rRNA processing protein RimM